MRLKVEPDVIALAPGDVTDLLVQVHNDGEDACTPFLQVRGIDPVDVLLPEEIVAVPAGSVMTAVVRVRAAVDAVPGDQRIAVAAEDLDGGQGAVSAQTVLRIGARPDVAVEVDPVATVGRRGAKAMTILRNRSDRRLQIDLEGRGEGVRVAFRPSRVTLDPGETRRVRTRMRRAQRSWFAEIRHGAVITARGIGAPAATTATFTQRPSVPRPAVRTVAALTALAVWVAASVVVFERINAEPEAGPDTGLAAGPAEPGPGRTSATGLGVEEEEPGVSLPVVIQGTIEGPRDPSGTTVTAERIGFGDEGTTTGLTKVVALAEVKLPRGNVLDVVRTSTDERGRFRIASGLVEDAFYRVTATRAGFEVGSFIVSTTADEPEVTLAVALEPADGSLSGSVKDSAGTAVGGATVLVTDGSATYTTVTPAEGTDAGRWTLEGLATPATYQVIVSRRGFAAQTLIVELEGGQARTGVDAVLVADLGTIVGRVTDANPDPNQPSVAQGVGALTVTLAGPEARETRTLTVAGDLRGTFDLPGLPYGDYKVTFSGEGWVTREAEVTVDAGLVRLDATATRSTGFVQGWVWQTATGEDAFQGECRYPRIDQRDGAGATAAGTRTRPCGGVSVTVASDDGDLFATASADATGFFQIGGVPAGAYTLTLARPGYDSYVRSIDVAPGGTFDLNPDRTAASVALADAVTGTDYIPLGLAAPPAVCAGTVVLTLVDFRDGVGVDPVTDATGDDVITVSDSDDCDPAPSVTRVGTSASYRIDNVPLGKLQITVGGSDATDWAYAETDVEVSVSAADLTAVTMNILPKPRTLTLPAGTIRLDGPTGADRDVVVEVINVSGTNVGPIGGTTIPIDGNGANAEVDLELVGPDRDLRLRAVGSGSPARGYETVTSASFALPPGLAPFELPLLAGPSPRLTVTATTTVTGTVYGFTGSPLALAPLTGATVTFPAQSRPDAADTNALSVTTAADGTFSATIRAGTYLEGATVDRTTGAFGDITVAAAGFDTRVFNPSAGDALVLTGVDGVLRDGSTDFFLLYETVGGAETGDVGLDPAARDVTIPVSLAGAAGASRTLSVALSGGTVLEDATARDTPTPTPTPPAAASVTVGTPSDFSFTGVRPGDYTVTVTGQDAVTTTTTITVPVGTGTFTPSAVEVVATSEVTVTVSEDVVLGATTTETEVPGAVIAATDATAADDTGTTDAAGQVTLTLVSGVTYALSITKDGYTPPTGLTVAVGAAPTQDESVSLPAATTLRVFGEVSDSVRSVRVLDGATEEGIAENLGAGTKSYAIDGLPTGQLLQVDFRDENDDVLVSRWIQVAQAGNVSIQLDQDAEPGDLGAITVNVEVPEAPTGVTTPNTVVVRLIENVPSDFYSIGATGVITAESDPCTGAAPRTCTVAFPGLATAGSSTSLPTGRFSVAIDATEGSSLIPTDYAVSSAGSFTSVEVGDTSTFVLRTRPGVPAAPTLTVVPQSGTSNQRIDVSWSAPSNTGGAEAGDLTYVVGYRVGSSGAFTELPPTGAGVTTASITGLSEGTTYEVRVRAVSTVGDVALVGADSPVATATTADVPETPALLTATATSSSLNISWVAPVGDGGATITSYTVTVGGTVRCSGSTATSCNVTGLASGTTYSVAVTATNVVGTGDDVTSNFSTVAQAGSPLSIGSTGVYEARRTGATEGVHVERGWWFRVDTAVTIDAFVGPGGVNNDLYTMRLRSGGQGATPTSGAIERVIPNIPGTNGCGGKPTVVSMGAETERLEPGTWYAVTTQNQSSTSVSFCEAQVQDSLAVFSFSGSASASPSGTVQNSVGPAHSKYTSRDVAVGFRVATVHN